MTEPLSQYKVEKNEEKADSIAVHFNNVDGSFLRREVVRFIIVISFDELFITCVRPSIYIQKHSCEEIYKQDIIETIQDWYKMPVKEFNWIKR